MSQTAVNDGAGAKSPMAAIGTALTVILTLLFLAPVFSYLPQAALGALVFVAAIGLVDIATLRQIFSVERRDGVLAIIAALAVIATGALYGIVAAVLISVLTLLFQLSRRPLDVVEAAPRTWRRSDSHPARDVAGATPNRHLLCQCPALPKGVVRRAGRKRSEALHCVDRCISAVPV